MSKRVLTFLLQSPWEYYRKKENTTRNTVTIQFFNVLTPATISSNNIIDAVSFKIILIVTNKLQAGSVLFILLLGTVYL